MGLVYGTYKSWYFLNCRIVKLSSPYLNVLIITGVIWFYVDVILFGIDEGITCRSSVNALCMVNIIKAIAIPFK